MSQNWSQIVTAVLILFVLGLSLMVLLKYTPKTKVYNCSIAEFHPDFPIAVKEQCRAQTKQSIKTIK